MTSNFVLRLAPIAVLFVLGVVMLAKAMTNP